MAIVYCYSGAVGLNNGTSWTDAYTTFAAALSGATPGTDQIYLARDHSESSTSLNFVFPTSSPAQDVYSINRADDTYSVATGDQFTATTGSITFDGAANVFGIQANATTDIILNADSSEFGFFQDCYFKPGNNSSVYNGVSGKGRVIDCTMDCTNDTGASTTGIFGTTSINNTYWTNISFANVTNRSRAFIVNVQGSGNHFIEGCDLSNFDYLIDANAAQTGADITFHGCILKSGYTISDSTFETRSWVARTIGCDISGSNKKYLMDSTVPALGNVIIDETTTRTGGATDPDSNLISWKTTTTADCFPTDPFIIPHPIVGWLDSTGSKTFKLHIAHTNAGSGTGSAIRNDDMWMELVYLGTAGNPTVSIASTRWNVNDPTTTPTDYTTNTETWGGTPGDRQEMSLTVTVNQTGPYKIRVYAGKTSMGAVYIDPKVVIA